MLMLGFEPGTSRTLGERSPSELTHLENDFLVRAERYIKFHERHKNVIRSFKNQYVE